MRWKISPQKLCPLLVMAALFVAVYFVSQSVPEETIRAVITQAEFHDVISYAAGLTNLKFWP